MHMGGNTYNKSDAPIIIITPLSLCNKYPPSQVEELDKKLLVVLRDGSKILGTLRSFDQFANIVLESAVERIIVGASYSDIPLGLYIVRGENVVLMGEVDEARETEGLTAVDNDEIKRAREAEKAAEKLKGEMLKRMDFLDME